MTFYLFLNFSVPKEHHILLFLLEFYILALPRVRISDSLKAFSVLFLIVACKVHLASWKRCAFQNNALKFYIPIDLQLHSRTPVKFKIKTVVSKTGLTLPFNFPSKFGMNRNLGIRPSWLIFPTEVVFWYTRFY